MARNKYPEQTIAKILDISFSLFMKQGYDKTSIQDIVNAIGMSKGAIYHHFKSKEAILEAIAHRLFEERYEALQSLPNHLNGLQKLRFYLRTEFENQEKQQLDYIMKPMTKNPQFLSLSLQGTHTNASFILPLLEDGLRDGSIQVVDPSMTAEFILILCNIWINPLLWTDDDESMFLRKLLLFKTTLEGLGIPIIDDELLTVLRKYYHSVQPQ